MRIQTPDRRRLISSLSLLALLSPALAQVERGPGSTRPPQQPVVGGMVVTTLDDGLAITDVVRQIVGPGVVVTDISFVAGTASIGNFTGGTAAVGFENGIVLSTGLATDVVGPMNMACDTTGMSSGMGDADLDALIPQSTADATVLEFEFICGQEEDVEFQYVFGSEEYNEFVDFEFNDVFAFFLNGENIALIPGTTEPVSISTVNCGSTPMVPNGGPNCELFINNACGNKAPFGCPGWPCDAALPFEMDGLTTVFTASGTLQPGSNHIKLAIADTVDMAWDSNVLIRAQSFGCALGPPFFIAPSPCEETLTASVGSELSFSVAAAATHNEPNQCVTISVAGDAAPLAAGSFSPTLPSACAQPATSTFSWTPTLDDVGTHTLVFTATDDLGGLTTCSVTIEVAECYLIVGLAPNYTQHPMGGPEDMLLVRPRAIFPVTMEDIPTIQIPDAPGLIPSRLYFQVTMENPFFDPADPIKVSNGLEVHIGGPALPYGVGDGIELFFPSIARPGGGVRVAFDIEGF